MFDDPVAFSIGGIAIRWYALFILTGAFLGAWLVSRLARTRGLKGEAVWEAIPLTLLAAIAGARLYYVALQWPYFAANPLQILNTRAGGLSIHGGIIAGFLAVVLFTRYVRQPLRAWLDVVVPGLALGQGIGRWGNYANQEAFGRPTDLPWGISIRPENRPEAYAEFSHFHPTFLYESLLDLLNAALLTWLILRLGRWLNLRSGDVFAIYLINYGIIRLPLEWLRTDSLYIGPLPAAYWASGLQVLIGALLLVANHTIWRSEPIAQPGVAAGTEPGSAAAPHAREAPRQS